MANFRGKPEVDYLSQRIASGSALVICAGLENYNFLILVGFYKLSISLRLLGVEQGPGFLIL